MFIQARVTLETADNETRDKLEKIVKGLGARFVYLPEIKVSTENSGKSTVISNPQDLSSDKIVREVILRRFEKANARAADSMDDEEKALLEEIITKARGGNEE